MTVPAKIRQEIQKRLQEIEAYRSHSLFKEARVRCQELAAFIKKTPDIPNKEKLLGQLVNKVKKIDDELKTFDDFSSGVEMSSHEQTVVKELFTSGKKGDAKTAFETATAMLVFGQWTPALKALRELLGDDTHRVAAAKSIIRCHLGAKQYQAAVNDYLAWFQDDNFPRQALDSVRAFLQAALEKKGFKQKLPVPIIMDEVETQAELDDEPEDFLSIVITYGEARRLEKKEAVLDVNFQSGMQINCIVPWTETGLIDFLKPGTVIPDVQLNGVDMITFSSVRLKEVSKIRVGRFAGDTTITLLVLEDD